MYLINSDPVINHIVEPYLTMPLDISKIEGAWPSGWLRLNLPEDMDTQIAYVIQLLQRQNTGEKLLNYASMLFKNDRYNDDISELNVQLLGPCFRELCTKLEDLKEDNIAGKDTISPANLSIHIENLQSNGSQINIGTGNTLISTSDRILNELLQYGFPSSKLESVKEPIAELCQEDKKQDADESTAKKAFSSIRSIGEKVAVEVLIKYLTNPSLIRMAHGVLKQIMAG